MKALSIVGARPQFVKAGVIAREFKKFPEWKHELIHSGQHYDTNMSAIFFGEMKIPTPSENLMISGGGHGEMTGKMLISFEKLFMRKQPDIVIVYGDTNTTLAASLVAKKLRIKIAHVEAGVRNHDEYMPEEINRVITDRLADLNFTCTAQAVDNLYVEGLVNSENKTIINTGDVMYDAYLFYRKHALQNFKQFSHKEEKPSILVTLHRPENVDYEKKMRLIFSALNTLSKDYNIIFPIHPRTSNRLKEFGIQQQFNTIEPVGYFEILQKLNSCSFVITDSGGLVREAYFEEKMSVYLLNNHVWPEIVAKGASINVDILYEEQLHKAVEKAKKKPVTYDAEVFGRGQAGKQIVSGIIKYFE